jgi:hypothetical protein
VVQRLDLRLMIVNSKLGMKDGRKNIYKLAVLIIR